MMDRRTLIAALIPALLGACSPDVPDVEIPADYDLGVVVKGELASGEIPVRNVGSGRLTVLGISTSCGCTKATASSPTVEPGGDARLHVVYDSGAHEEDLGRIERFVFVATDDPDEQEVQVKISVLVKQKR